MDGGPKSLALHGKGPLMTGKASDTPAVSSGDAALPPLDPWGARAKLVRLIGANQIVLDVGCGAGWIAAHLKAQGCRVTGIEIDPELAAAARPFCERVIVADADNLAELGLPENHFEVVLFADVLEHLVDPWHTLRSVRPYLRPTGRVLLSLPNFANYSIRWALLRGQFRYQESGLFDRDHLRFFTRETALELVTQAGLQIIRWETTANLTQSRPFRATLGRLPWGQNFFRAVDDRLAAWFPTLLACQFILECRLR